MIRKLSTFKLPERTRQQLEELATAWGMTLTQVVMTAIAKLYEQAVSEREKGGAGHEQETHAAHRQHRGHRPDADAPARL